MRMKAKNLHCAFLMIILTIVVTTAEVPIAIGQVTWSDEAEAYPLAEFYLAAGVPSAVVSDAVKEARGKAEEIAAATDLVVDVADVREAIATIYYEESQPEGMWPGRYPTMDDAWARVEEIEALIGYTPPVVLTTTVTYDYYVVAGYNMTPTPPAPAPSPPGFNFIVDPPVYNFGNITKAGNKTWLYRTGYAKVNITNLLGYDIVITSLTAEVTAGTATLGFYHVDAYYGNHSLVWFDALDPNEDECDYYTGEVTLILHDGDWRAMAIGIPYPEGGVETGPASLLEPDLNGDAAATGHVAPIQLANGSTFTEYFGVFIFGDANVGTQIDGTITLSLTYEYELPLGYPVPSFTYTPTTPVVDEPITFNASGSTPNGGNITSYAWDFGDGTNGTGMIVNHTYTAPGTYTVILNVTDSEGMWSYASKFITVRAAPRIIWVPDNFTSIQEAINNANDWDTISVRAGTYHENVVVNKRVSLVGEEKETTIIDGNMSGTVLRVTATGVFISNFTIRNSGNQTMDSGITVEWRSRCDITNNLIISNQYGILLWGSDSTISGNNVTNNRYGIYLISSANSTISGNYVSNNRYGIWLMSSPNSVLSGNVMNGNKYGFSAAGDPTLSIDVSNLVNGKPVYYLVNQKDLVINSSTHPDVGYLALVNCSNIVVEGLTLTNNGQGILLANTDNSRITGNNITNNEYGVWLMGSNNTIHGNNITDNRIGVGLWGSNNTITKNTFVNGGLLVFSYGNLVENNTVNGKPLVYLEGVSDYTVKNAGQVILVNCSRIRVENLDLSNATIGVELLGTNSTKIAGNNLTNNMIGVWLMGSNNTIHGNNIANNLWVGVWLMVSANSTISGNNVTNNLYGVWLMGSNNTIAGNNIANNSGSGIYLSSDNVVVERNRITDNYCGVRILYGRDNLLRENDISGNVEGIHLEWGAKDNQIYHNNFIGNTEQVFSYDSTNVWDDGYPSGGNYWSDYNGTDTYSGVHQNETGYDWIGDTPYIIDQDNRDNYSLIDPYVPERQETRVAYRNLLGRYNELLSDFNSINSTYYELLDSYSELLREFEALNATYDNLNSTYYTLLSNHSELQGNYNSLQTSYDDLQASYDSLNSSYNSLNATYNELKSKQEATINGLNNIRNLMYISIATTIIFIATTVYLATRKPKAKPESTT